MQLPHRARQAYKLLEAVGGMDDGGGSLVGISPAHRGVEPVGMGLEHTLDCLARLQGDAGAGAGAGAIPLVARRGSWGSQCRQWRATGGRSHSCRRRSGRSPGHRLQSGVGGSAPRVLWVRVHHVAYLGVVGVDGAIAVDGRGVYGSGIWAGGRLQVVRRVC